MDSPFQVFLFVTVAFSLTFSMVVLGKYLICFFSGFSVIEMSTSESFITVGTNNREFPTSLKNGALKISYHLKGVRPEIWVISWEIRRHRFLMKIQIGKCIIQIREMSFENQLSELSSDILRKITPLGDKCLELQIFVVFFAGYSHA